MSRREQLREYIAQVRRRLRLDAGLRGVAAIGATALVATIILTAILNAYAFPEGGLAPARVALLALVIAAVCFGLAWPLWRLTVGRSVGRAEKQFPEFEQRLVTFHERENAAEAGSADANAALFQELLAADTLKVAETAQPQELAPQNRLLWMVGVCAACLGVLVWLVAARPGFIGYGASLLWTGPHKDVPPIYQINVKPGNAAVRRNSDALVTAQVVGLETSKVNLFARYGTGAKWEQVAMQPVEDGSGFQFLFAGLPENVEYYVQAGAAESKHFRFRVVDLPSVKTMAVTYHYPKWTGLQDVSEEQAGDLRAIEGTDAALTVTMSAPLKDGMLVLDDNQTAKLMPGSTKEGANVYHATLHMTKDGAYHVAGVDEGQQVRLSEDYFIATSKANPPSVAISRPGGDYRASPIEEVTVGVNAGADFGLRHVALHYSVNGGPEQTVNVLKQAGAKDATGTATLSLEDFKLQPGDVISLYATAEDAHQDAKTDISFIQVDPFEREFSQSQQSGGGGGGGGGNAQNQTDISRREKELIAETFKQMNAKGVAPDAAKAQGKLLGDAQAALRQQAEALSARMQTRDLSAANEEFNSFDKDMEDAAKGMQPAADKLKAQQWQQAMPLEQKVLQALLRAEATFRQIQVAFGRRGGGGGGGGGGAGRDLASLFDLEMDTEKNQYETAQAASPQEQQQKKVDDALAKLDALAKRQEELAQNQGAKTPTFQERWQQEMLRREAEQLQREMEQMQGQQGQQSGQQSGQQQSGQQGQQGQSGQQSGSQQSGQQSASASGSPRSGRQGTQDGNADPRVSQALQRLRAANDAMGQAGQQQNAQQSADAAKRAADRLREATDLLGGAQQQQASGRLGQLGRDADRLSREESAQADRVKKLAAQSKAMQDKANSGGSPGADEMAAAEKERQSLANDRQQMSGDLEQLERQMRNAARDIAPTQPGAASSLRDALNGMDQNDLTNLVQRTADWLREGVNPNSNGTETEIANSLKKMDDQVRKAVQQAGSGEPGKAGDNGTQTAALDHVDRLRDQIQSLQLGRGNGQQNGQRNGQNGQPGQQQGQSGRGGNQQANGQQPGNQRGQNGQQQGQGGQQQGQQQGGQRGGQQSGQQNGQGGRGGQNGQQQAQNGQGGGQGVNAQRGGNQNGPGGARNGQLQRGGNDQRPQQFGDGPLRGGGGSQDANLNVDLGGQNFTGTRDPNAPRVGPNPADRQRVIDQGLGELSQLRQEAKGNAQAQKDIDALQDEMKKLDPSRFQGNPEVVAALHQKVLSDVDKLELELRRDPNQPQSGEARTSAPAAVPQGYEESVAEYYRRLGKGQ